MDAGNGRSGAARSSDTPKAPVVEVTLSEERAVARRLRVPVERLRVAKRIRTRTVRVQVDVEVAYEELVVTRHRVPDDEGLALAVVVTDDDLDARQTAGQPPVVLVLSEQVPVVELRTRPVERVTVSAEDVQTLQRIQVDLAHEVADVQRSTTGAVQDR